MASGNQIDVKVWPAGEAGAALTELPVGGRQLEFRDVDYISLINDETYGIPALITERLNEVPFTVLYVNPQNVVAMEAVRKA